MEIRIFIIRISTVDGCKYFGVIYTYCIVNMQVFNLKLFDCIYV